MTVKEAEKLKNMRDDAAVALALKPRNKKLKKDFDAANKKFWTYFKALIKEKDEKVTAYLDQKIRDKELADQVGGVILVTCAVIGSVALVTSMVCTAVESCTSSKSA